METAHRRLLATLQSTEWKLENETTLAELHATLKASDALKRELRPFVQAPVASVPFLQPGRHHFLLQCYLEAAASAAPAARTSLTWLGPGRLGLARHADGATGGATGGDGGATGAAFEAELAALREALLGAAKRMQLDGWWAAPLDVAVASHAAIRGRLLAEVLSLLATSAREACVVAMGWFLL